MEGRRRQHGRLWVRAPRLPLPGAWSNRTTPAPQARNPGASPGDSTRDGPVVQRQRRLVPTQETMVRLHPGLLDCPGTPIGRAAWLKPRRMQVRLRPWARPGRQTADHLGLEPGMLWVRVPPGPLKTNQSSWSSLECSPACHAGRPRKAWCPGFKSCRGRFRAVAARYANRQSGQAQTLVMCGFDSRLRH